MSTAAVPIKEKEGAKTISDMPIEIQIVICGYALSHLPPRIIPVRDESAYDREVPPRFISCRPYHYFGDCHEAWSEILVVRKEGEKLARTGVIVLSCLPPTQVSLIIGKPLSD